VGIANRLIDEFSPFSPVGEKRVLVDKDQPSPLEFPELLEVAD